MFVWDVNNTPANGAVAIFDFKEHLKAQGWTVTQSGDGLALYSAVGDVITTAAAGAAGMANTRAWFVLQSPAGAGAPQFVFQRGTTNVEWRSKLGPIGGFTLGVPNSTTTPSAALETYLIGGGTDAAPTFAPSFLPADGGLYRWNIGADNAAPYGWWAQAFLVGGGVPKTTLIFDPLVATAPGEAFPYICVMGLSTDNLLSTTSGLSTEAAGAPLSSNRRLSYVPALVAATATDYTGFVYGVNTVGLAAIPIGLPTNPLTLRDEVLPIAWGRRSVIANAGWKGISTLLKWTATARATGDTLSVALPGDRIVMGVTSLPWPTGIVPAV